MSIDPTALNPYREVMGDAADSFVIELIDTFLTGTQEFVVALYTSISTGDAKVFSRAAHTLKSNSSIFGAELLSGMALELEKAGKTEDLATLLPKVDKLKIEYEQVCHELVDLRRSLSSVTISTIFFDLDDTLYPAKAGLWSNVRERINIYMRDRLHIPPQDVSAMRQRYLEQYGTTLLGLHHHYSLDVVEFLDFVHDLPLRDYIQPVPELRTIIQKLPARKFIFSNADVKHVQRVLTVLQLEDCFDGVLDILQMWPACKPMSITFEMALKMAGNPSPEQCVLIDDLARNTRAAREHGLFSILYGTHAATDPSAASATLTDWLHLPSIIQQL